MTSKTSCNSNWRKVFLTLFFIFLLLHFKLLSENERKQTFVCFIIQVNKIIIFSGQSYCVYDHTFAILKTLFLPFCFFLCFEYVSFANDICPLCCFFSVDQIQSVVVPFKFNCFIMPFNYEIHSLFAVFESIAMCTMKMKCFSQFEIAYIRVWEIKYCSFEHLTVDGTKMKNGIVDCRLPTLNKYLMAKLRMIWLMDYHLLYRILNFQWELRNINSFEER